MKRKTTCHSGGVMKIGKKGRAIAIALLGAGSVLLSGGIFRMDQHVLAAESLCPAPALSRITTHRVQPGETLESIAATYELLPLTLLAINPSLQGNSLAPGTTLKIPPFNGVVVNVSAGQTWQDLAAAYRVRADVLFEVNGCPDAVPSQIFVPGVSWLLEGQTAAETTSDPLSTYPLSTMGTIVANYGWQTDADLDELVFSSGVTLSAPLETSVVAAGSGTVAFVGEAEALGVLVIINHDQGFQTRYASVVQPRVNLGDQVRAGQPIAIARPATEESSLLYFEVRTNSNLGWVARNPGDYIPELKIR